MIAASCNVVFAKEEKNLDQKLSIINRRTRCIKVGDTLIGGKAPIALQSMCATRTTDISATVAQCNFLKDAGADLVRLAVDNIADVAALREIRKETEANLVIDLQEGYRLAADVAPFVQKIRYNPGHLHHHQKEIPVLDKVQFLVDIAGNHDCALRVGVNFGSLDPKLRSTTENPLEAALRSAEDHCDMLEKLGFTRYVVSLKSSDPNGVVEINRHFAVRRPLVPIHLGVTEAGMYPEGAIKTRIAFEQLLPFGIGDTIRVSLTVPDTEKDKELIAAKEIVQDIIEGRFSSATSFDQKGLNVISCPSCSRVENKAFIKLASEVKAATSYAKDAQITIAVMGCRVNGPGETDDADLGLWCGPHNVKLKRGTELVGAYAYDEVVSRLLQELDRLLMTKKNISD